MTLIQSGSREDAIHALINLWLKDTRKTCGLCGAEYVPGKICCDQPFPSTNSQQLQQFTHELRIRRDSQKNKFASTDNKSLRTTVSIPAGLYVFLNSAMQRLYGEELFTKEHNHIWFAKKFGKYFGVAEVI